VFTKVKSSDVVVVDDDVVDDDVVDFHRNH